MAGIFSRYEHYTGKKKSAFGAFAADPTSRPFEKITACISQEEAPRYAKYHHTGMPVEVVYI